MSLRSFPPSRSDRWESIYESAVSDSEYSVNFDRIADARNAIFDRAEELLDKGSSEERTAINCALRTLRLLEKAGMRRSNAA